MDVYLHQMEMSGTHCIRGCVGSRAGLNRAKRKYHPSYRKLNLPIQPLA